ncbi:MAG: hypothetical protein RL691_634, partial [Actinomycetota bacterium]
MHATSFEVRDADHYVGRQDRHQDEDRHQGHLHLEHLRQEFGYSGGRLWGLIASRPDAFELLKDVGACRYRLRATALLQPGLRPPEEEAAEEARRQLVLDTTIQKALAAPRSPKAAAGGHNRAIAATPPALLAAIDRLLPAEPSDVSRALHALANHLAAQPGYCCSPFDAACCMRAALPASANFPGDTLRRLIALRPDAFEILPDFRYRLRAAVLL